MSMMGGDAEIGFTAKVDADAAADELKDEFTKAIADAMKSPALEQAMRRMALSVGVTLKKSINDAMSGKGRGGGGDPFKPLVTSADRAAKQISRRFEKVARDAAKSFDNFKGPGASGLRGMSAQVEAIARSFDDLRAATDGQIRAMESMERLARQSADVQARLNRDLASSEQQTARERLVADQTTTARALSNARRRLEIFRQVAAQIRFVERQLGVAFQRGAEIATRALRGLGRVVESLARTIGTRFNNIFRGRGGDDGLTSSMRRRERTLQTSFNRQEAIMRNSAAQQSAILTRMNQQQERGLAGLVSGRSALSGAFGIGGLAAGGLGIGSLLRSGFERAGAEERLDLQFTALLQDGDRAAQVLQQLSDYARTTAFDFTEVAASVASMTAAFSGDVGRATEINQFLADVVALTGGGNQQFSGAALAFRQIASAGRLMGDELRQLEESLPGIPIRDILIDTFFEGDKAAFAKAQQAGKLGEFVSADAFFDAVMAGVQQRFPEAEGFAIEAATTLSGMAANLRENFEIFGAEIIRVFEGPIKSFIGGLNDLLDGLGNFISGEGLTPGLERLRDVLGDFGKGIIGLGALKALGEALRFAALGARALLTPLGLLVTLAGGVSVFWGMLTDASESLRDAIDGLMDSLGPLLSAFSDLATGGLNALFERLTGSESGLQSIGDAVAGVVDKITEAITKTTEWLELLRDALGLPSGDASAPGGRRPGEFSAANPFAGMAQGTRDVDVAGALTTGAYEDVLVPISELPEEAQKVFAEKFADVEWVSPQDAARIWEQFSPDAEELASAVTPEPTAVEKARQTLLKRLSDLFGLDDVQFLTAMSSGGNRLLNVLEQTWLGPVIRFFRGPFADGVRTAWGFLTGTIIPGVAGAFSAVSGFITNTVIPGVQSAIEFFRNDFLPLMSDIWDEVTTFFEPAFSAVADAVSGAWDVIQPIIQPFIDGVTELFNMIRDLDFSELDLGNVAAGAGIGGGIGLLLGGPLGALLGGAAGALTQTPVFDGLIESIDNGWTLVQAKLEEFWTNFTGWLGERFSAKNLKRYTIGFFNGLREIGEQIGRILSEPEVIAGAVAFGAAIAAILLSFTVGLVQGVASNVGEWAKIIGDGLNAAWGALSEGTLNFLPDPIANAISALLENPVITTATLALGTGLAALIFTGIGSAVKGKGGGKGGRFSLTSIATSIAGGLLSVLSTTFKQTFKGGANLVKMIFGGDVSSTMISRSTEGKLQGVGTSIASAIAVGIGSFALGQAAGRSGSGGNILLAILGGAGAGAALGTAIAPGVGTAIGAALGAGAAGIGAFFGNAAREAEEAAAAVQEFTDALLESGSAGVAIEVRDEFRGLDDDVRDVLSTAGFNIGEFVTGALEDARSTGQEVANILLGLGTATGGFEFDVGDDDERENFFAVMEALSNLPEGDNFIDLANAVGGITSEPWKDFLDVLGRAGLEAEELQQIIEFITGQRISIEGAQELAGQLETVTADAEQAKFQFEGVADAAELIAQRFSRGKLASDITAILNQSNLSTQERFDALSDAAETLRDRVGEVRDALAEMAADLVLGESTDLGAIRRDFRLELPNVEQQIANALGTAEGEPISIPAEMDIQLEDEISAIKEDFRTGVAAALSEAISAGEISSEVDLTNFIEALRGDIESYDLSPSVERVLLEQLGLIEVSLEDLTFTDLDAAEAAARQAGAAIATALRGPVVSVGGGGFFGGGFELGGIADAAVAALGIGEGDSNPVQDELDGMANSIDYSSIQGVGEKIPGEVKSGIEANKSQITSGVVAGVNAAAVAGNFGAIAMRDPGRRMADQLAAGLTAGAGAVLGAGANAARVGAAGASFAAGAFYSAGKNMANSMAAGLSNQASAVANAAAFVAAVAAAAARRALRIASPSKVFVDIGKQVGEGFAEGIRDSETTMSEAISSALTKAIDDATEKVGRQVARAKAAQEIFEALAPSLLPGGTTQVDNMLAGVELIQSIRNVAPDVRSARADSFGQRISRGASYVDSGTAINMANLNLRTSLEGLRGELTDARAQQNAINKYNRDYATLTQRMTAGATKAIRDQAAEDRRALGSRPEALDLRQRYLLQQGVTTLASGSFAGAANREAFTTGLESIGEWAQAALEAGSSAASVTSTVNKYVASLKATAVAYGLNSRQLDDLIAQYGLSTAQLADWAKGLTDLSTATVQGTENIANFLGQFQGIREFGSGLIGSGVAVTTAVEQMKAYRNAVLQQATALGFSGAELAKLVEQVGLSDAALAEFVRQMREFDKAANAATPQEPTTSAPQAQIDALNVYLPYGDPSAVALSVANRLSYTLPRR